MRRIARIGKPDRIATSPNRRRFTVVEPREELPLDEASRAWLTGLMASRARP